MKEIARELAKLLIPLPQRERDESNDQFGERLKLAWKQRHTLTGELLMSARASELDDPVLARLNELKIQKEDIQRQIRLIVAYSREFIRPEPYRLKTLATATGLSISGTRTIYSSDDVALIATRIGRQDSKSSIFPASSQKPEKAFEGEQWWVPPRQPAEDRQEPPS
ncbi:hypothetical protein HD597_004753 [Nonomuraea thailandensis]|uniref:Uncharacterized protein n=1 Tax=Nonomuraea thailandensis TaxID=1188745 RepID=A0A9X2GNU0_9ACTN|nr:hypothetical protein [Nonomuraea thailandensis]MCP2357733.1 hypothetical protein [Nonomuraea thailandensis]